jgi:hypothetical protein
MTSKTTPPANASPPRNGGIRSRVSLKTNAPRTINKIPIQLIGFMFTLPQLAGISDYNFIMAQNHIPAALWCQSTAECPMVPAWREAWGISLLHLYPRFAFSCAAPAAR